MSVYKYSLVVFLTAMSLITKAQQNNTLTLQQCLDIAVKNNLQVKQSGLTAETDKVYYQQAKENLLPGINGDVTHTLSNGRSQDPTTYNYVNKQITYANYGLTGNLTLFNGLALVNNIKQTSLAYQAGKMDFQQAKDLVTINVITTYLQILNNQDLLIQANGQVDVSKKQLERLQILNKSGAIKPSDMYDVQGQLANDQLTVINTKNTLEAAKLTLLQIMNVPYSKDIQLQPLNAEQLPGQYNVTADQVYNAALNDLALVKAATLRRQSAEKGVSVAKGGLFPTLSLSGGLYTNYSSSQQKLSYESQFKNNYNTGVNLGLHIPILNYFQNRNRVSLAKINLLNAKYVEESTQVQLKQSVEQAYVNMTSAYERYQVLVDQVKAFTESFRTAEIRFNAGSLTSVDFVVAKNNMDRANTNLISARYDYFIRTKILDYYQGKLSFQ